MAMVVTFNNGRVIYDITDRFIVGDLVKGYSKRTVNSIKVPGMDGELFGSSNLAPIDVSMTITFVSQDEDERFDALRELAGVLNTYEPGFISIYDENETAIYGYKAVPSCGNITRYVGAESFTLTFTALDPVMYGADFIKTVTGASYSFVYDGNYPSQPIILSTGAVAASGIFGISINGGMLDIPIDDTSQHSIVVDSCDRKITVDGNSVLPTLASDWPEIVPGSNTVSISSGSATTTRVKYTERYL